MKRALFRLVALALFCLVVAAAVAAAEFGSFALLRLKGKTQEPFGARYSVDPNTYAVPFIGYRYKPQRKGVRPGLDTDRHGFIHNGNPERNLAGKPPGVFRIFILGSSTVAGNSAPEDTLSAILERELNRTGTGQTYEVVNAGVSAWLSSQELALIQFYLPEYQPDLIITFDGYNDVYQVVRAPREGWHPNINGRMSELARASDIHSFSVRGTLAQAFGMVGDRMYLVNVFNEARAMVRSRLGLDAGAADDAEPADLPSNPLEHYRRNLEFMIAASRVIGASHLAVLQPIALPSNSRRFAYRQPFLQSMSGSWQRIDFWGEMETLYGEAERTFADLQRRHDDNRHVVVRDYAHMLDEETAPSYLDNVHYTPHGTRTLAARLADDIRATVLRSSAEQLPRSTKDSP